MNVIYQSMTFDKMNIVARYAKLYSNGEVIFYDVDSRKKTIREYWQLVGDVDKAVADQLVCGQTVELKQG